MSCTRGSRVYGNKPTFPCTTYKSCGSPFYAGKDCCPSEAKPLDLAESQWVEFPYIIQDLSGPGGTPVNLALPTPVPDSTEGATARYYINGKVMHLSYSYRFTVSAPASGVGTYFILLPNGYTYNNLREEAVGSVYGMANNGSRFTGTVTADFTGDNKRLVIYINDAANPIDVWGS